MLLTNEDKELLQKKGISESQIEQQLKNFEQGFPFLKLRAAASVGNGIIAPNAEEIRKYFKIWDDYKTDGHSITKFVPASGAASRMFKNMF